MTLDKISEEFRELNEIIQDKYLFMFSFGLLGSGEEIENVLLKMSIDLRRISQIEMMLENKKFESKIAQGFKYDCIFLIENIYKKYDELVVFIINNKKEGSLKSIGDGEKPELYGAIEEWNKIITKAKLANEIVSRIIGEMWEPLPDEKEEKKVNNIVLSSETRSMSLSDVARDVGNLDNFFKNISLLIKQDQNQSNNIYLRRVETGSLVVAVSCAMEIAPVIAFIFWCVKLYQKAEKRYLDNADKKLEVINKSMNIAKEILKVDPDNKEAEESIQKCGVHLLNFLENNPTGTINGEHYDIGIEKPKIEDKENK